MKIKKGDKVKINSYEKSYIGLTWTVVDVVKHPYEEKKIAFIKSEEKELLISTKGLELINSLSSYQLTKSQIIAIAENGSLIKELFPDCFELEVGKWYKSPHLGKALFCLTKIEENTVYGYGYDYKGIWNEESDFVSLKNKGDLTLANEEEVTEALKEEKRKRYKLHTDNIKWLSGEPIETLKGDLCYFEDNKLYASGGSKRWCLFDNGKWAEITQTPTEVIKVIETYGKDKLITLIEAYERNSK